MNPGTRLSATKVSLNPQKPERLGTQKNTDSNPHEDQNSIAAWDSQCGILLVVGFFFSPVLQWDLYFPELKIYYYGVPGDQKSQVMNEGSC